MSAQEVATAFVQHYYTTMDSNPSALASLYVSAATHPLTHSLTEHLHARTHSPELTYSLTHTPH